jgi:hypothetical protein
VLLLDERAFAVEGEGIGEMAAKADAQRPVTRTVETKQGIQTFQF